MKRNASSSSAGASSLMSSDQGGTSVNDATTVAGEEGTLIDGIGGPMKRTRSRVDEVFPAIFALPRAEWEMSKRFAAIYIFFDLLQIMLYVIAPWWGWKIAYKNKIVEWVYRAQFQNATASNSIVLSLALMYVSGIFTCLNVLAAVHIGWLSKQNKTVNKWEVRIVRISLILFQQIFFMSVLNFFLVPLSSDYWGTIYTKGALLYFPDKKISAYLPHAGIGLFFAALHITASFVTHFRYLDVNVIGNNTLCMFDGRHIARTYAAKVLIALISHLMPGYRRELATFIMMALYGYLAKIHVMSFPFAYLKQQYIYAAWHTMVFFWSIVLFAKEAQTHLNDLTMTHVLWYGIAPTLLGACVVLYLRQRLLRKTFHILHRLVTEEAHKDSDDELLDKFLWKTPEGPTLFVRAMLALRLEFCEGDIRVAELALRAAMAEFPERPLVYLLDASIKTYIKHDMQAAHHANETGRKLALTSNAVVKYMFFSFSRRHQLRSSGDVDGESGIDLQSYVEFQQNFKQLVKHHKAVVKADRSFWMSLLHSEVKLTRLTNSLQRKENLTTRAEASYRQALERYPKSVRLLRSYAHFLEEVHHDPYTAARYQGEADKLEDHLADAQKESGGGANGLSDMDESRDAICLINPTGSILFVNKALCLLFGGKKSDYEAKNVSMLMPPPFSQSHNQYLKNYAATGEMKVLDQNREVVAVHRDRYVFPVSLLVKKVQTGGADAFMGSLTPVAIETNYATVWLTANGLVICVSRNFSDLIGFKHIDLSGKSIATMTDGADQCQLIVEKAAELQVGSESPEDVPLRLKHKFGDVIETTGRIRIVGTDSVRIIALNLKLTEAAKAGILTVTYGGKMTFFNANALSILGFPEKDMLKMTLDDIIPAPYGLLHSMWVRRKNLSSTQAGSCRNGRYVQVQGRNGRLIPVALTVRDGEVTAAEAHHKGASEHPQTYTIRLAPIPSETLTFYGRCQFAVDLDTKIGEARGNTTCFGFDPAAFEGRLLSTIIPGFPEGDDGAQMLNLLCAAGKSDDDPVSFRVPVIGGSMLEVPAVVQVFASETGFTVNVYRADRLEVVVEADSSTGQILKISDSMSLVNGKDGGKLLSRTIMDVLPARFPTGKVGDILSTEDVKRTGGLRSKAMGVWKETLMDHADGRELHVGSVACTKHGNANVLLVLISVSAPTVSPLPEILNEDRDELRSRVVSQRRLVAIPSESEPDEDDSAEGAGIPKRGPRGAAARKARGRGARFEEPDEVEQTAKKGGSGGGGSGGDGGGGDSGDSSDEDRAPKHVSIHTQQWIEALGEADKEEEAVAEAVEPEAAVGDAEGGALPARKAPLAPGRLSVVNARRLSVSVGGPVPAKGGVGMGVQEQMMITTQENTLDEGGDEMSQRDNEDDTRPGAHVSTDYEKAKRFRRLLRLLNAGKAVEGLRHLKLWTIWSLLALIVVHAVQFGVVKNTITQFRYYIQFTAAASDQVRFVYRILLHCRVIESAGRAIGLGIPNFVYGPANMIASSKEITSLTKQLEEKNSLLYLGTGTGMHLTYQPLLDLYQKPSIVTTVFNPDGSFGTSSETLWDLTNTFIADAREVATIPAAYNTTMASFIKFRFLMANGPDVLTSAMFESAVLQLQRSEQVVKGIASTFAPFLVMESLFLVPAVIIFVAIMLRRVLRERARLFAVFLVVSKVTICELAQRPIRIGFEEEGDEDDDEDDTAALTKKTLMTAATSQDRKHAKKKLNEEQEKRYRLKQMTRLKAQNFKDYTRIVLPLIMWLGLSIAVVTSSWTFMTKDVTSLYLLKTRSYVDASIAMIRFYTGEIVTHTGALNDPVLLGSRTKLLNSKDFLTYYHTVSLYGSVAEKVPGNLLAQNWYYMSYYSKGCMRTTHPPCFNTSSPWYFTTTQGLDTALKYFEECATAIGIDVDGTQPPNNARVQYILQAGKEDIQDGSATVTGQVIARQQYLSSAEAMQTAILVVLVIGAAAYSFYILRPFINHMSAEMSYVASQLTQLPAATGTESLLMEFYAGKQSALGRKGWRRFVPCAPKAEEEESSDDDSEEEEEEDDGKKGGGKGKPMKVSSGRRR